MRSVRALIVVVLAACAADPAPGELALELTVPAALEVPAGNHVVAAYRAFGFQVYECQADAWKLRAPAATLVADDDALVAIHFGGIDAGLPAGPYWASTLDGSRVHGGNAVGAPNPDDAAAIPLLRLQGLDHAGAGLLANVSYIQRLDTGGGLAPTSRCKKTGSRAYVPYTARYVFWAPSLPRPAVPDALIVPEGHDVAFMGHATGAQVYECGADAVWRLRAPSALLEDETGVFIDHVGGIDVGLPAGPYWRSLRDGSRVHGGGAVPAPNPGTIALLRLTALDHAGNGILSRVSFIQRLATTGGVAPTTACSPGEVAPVPYTADYFFYVPTTL